MWVVVEWLDDKGGVSSVNEKEVIKNGRDISKLVDQAVEVALSGKSGVAIHKAKILSLHSTQMKAYSCEKALTAPVNEDNECSGKRKRKLSAKAKASKETESDDEGSKPSEKQKKKKIAGQKAGKILEVCSDEENDSKQKKKKIAEQKEGKILEVCSDEENDSKKKQKKKIAGQKERKIMKVCSDKENDSPNKKSKKSISTKLQGKVHKERVYQVLSQRRFQPIDEEFSDSEPEPSSPQKQPYELQTIKKTSKQLLKTFHTLSTSPKPQGLNTSPQPSQQLKTPHMSNTMPTQQPYAIPTTPSHQIQAPFAISKTPTQQSRTNAMVTAPRQQPQVLHTNTTPPQQHFNTTSTHQPYAITTTPTQQTRAPYNQSPLHSLPQPFHTYETPPSHHSSHSSLYHNDSPRSMLSLLNDSVDFHCDVTTTSNEFKIFAKFVTEELEKLKGDIDSLQMEVKHLRKKKASKENGQGKDDTCTSENSIIEAIAARYNDPRGALKSMMFSLFEKEEIKTQTIKGVKTWKCGEAKSQALNPEKLEQVYGQMHSRFSVTREATKQMIRNLKRGLK